MEPLLAIANGGRVRDDAASAAAPRRWGGYDACVCVGLVLDRRIGVGDRRGRLFHVPSCAYYFRLHLCRRHRRSRQPQRQQWCHVLRLRILIFSCVVIVMVVDWLCVELCVQIGQRTTNTQTHAHTEKGTEGERPKKSIRFRKAPPPEEGDEDESQNDMKEKEKRRKWQSFSLASRRFTISILISYF